MLKRFVLLLLLCSGNMLIAQKPSGLWVLKYVKALQPVFTMVQIDGQYEMVDEDPQDSTFLYNSGLMTLEFSKRQKPVSHAWDGKEQWEMDLKDNEIFLYGKRDTLYGSYNTEEIILRSTLDDRPTYYHFTPLKEKKISTPAILEGKWQIDSSNRLLKDLQISFSEDSTFQITTGKSLESKVYFTYDMEKIKGIEYDFPPKTIESKDNELGTIYLFKTRRKTIKGVFYPVTDGVSIPIRSELTLLRIDN
ncbi:hypothetical protein [Roseivirga sp. E12]|uniref:hypothetical protein n=1 Tax=Roseivirga sp. E12 TaxID=2819237 RepID=UPI001ABD36E9|nr:hypothetical protein [Roseivirga sp. E12]MBO3698826.1 hypothetical protein [Roseivirga sp. E12]